MIESLHISGFKLFRDITLPRLGRLNLFVGENASGKSCLLEAVNLYAGRTTVAQILQIAARRSAENVGPWDPVELREEGTPLRHPVFHLFHQSGPFYPDPHIVIGKIGDPRPLRMEPQNHYTVIEADGARRYVPVPRGGVAAEGVEMAIAAYRGDKKLLVVTPRLRPALAQIPDAEKALNEDTRMVTFFSASGLSDLEAASMWDALVQGPGQNLVLSWLRIMDPRIEALDYVGGRGSRVPLLKTEAQGRLPLWPMGGGLTRLLHLALAFAASSEGILLIDEFENGLHWSVQAKLWKALAGAARQFDAQVFATTHSRDCIEGFTAAAKDAGPEGAAIYRLERTRKGDDIFATELPLINVDAAMQENMEVR